MIRKYLICSKKNVYLQGKNRDGYEALGRVVELVMPIRNFWEIEKLVNAVNYLVASDELPPKVVASYRRVIEHSAPFAVREVDREWLYGFFRKE